MRTELPEAPIVREILTRLATELNEPRITQDLQLIATDKDFDNREFSIIDLSDHRIVVKVGEDHLHDYQSTPEVRRALDHRIREALRTHYATKKKAS